MHKISENMFFIFNVLKEFCANNFPKKIVYEKHAIYGEQKVFHLNPRNVPRCHSDNSTGF